MSIQVHYRESDGTTGVINYFSGENAACVSQGDVERLRNKAQHCVGEWTKIYPETKFFIVEDGRRR